MPELALGIMLVEDDPTHAAMVAGILGHQRYGACNLHQAADLNQAFSLLRGWTFDAVLLDLNLPDSLGFDILARALAASLRTPVVVPTGVEGDDLALAALKEGVQDYLRKSELSGPLLGRALLYAVERGLAEHKTRLDLDDLRAQHRRQADLLRQANLALTQEVSRTPARQPETAGGRA